ncbi:hypothetical protein U1Q18_000811 [Sarracenia purpurea var. burkii]
MPILGFDRKDYANSRKFLIDLMKHSLILGADRVLMDRKWSVISDRSRGVYHLTDDGPESNSEARKISDGGENANLSRVVNCPEEGYSEFPLNLFTFSAILVFKLIGFQINLVTSFLSLPIWFFSYSAFMFVTFPFQILTRIKENLAKSLLTMWADLDYLTIASFVFPRLKSIKPVLNLAMRFGRAVFWSIYVGVVLLGLLLSGFVLGGLATRRLVEPPVRSAETLDFDYAKASPVALVPIVSAAGSADVFSGQVSKEGAESGGNGGPRAIPFNHKLKLTVALTLPESEYNRQLGVFQVSNADFDW